MRNLYRLLGLGPTATENEIRMAMHRLTPADQEVVEHILLHPNRRRAYDHAFSSMVMITNMRRRLGITQTSTWSAQHVGDWIEPARDANPAPPSKPNSQPAGPAVERSKKERKVPYVKLAIAAVVVFFLIRSCDDEEARQPMYPIAPTQPATERQSDVENNTDTTDARVIFDEPVVPAPKNGKIFKRRGPDLNRLTVDNGTDYDHLLKLYDGSMNRVVREFYVRKHDRVTIGVPSGSFELFAMAGQEWYGPKLKFGPDHSVFKFDERLDYDPPEGQRITYELTLHTVPGGNIGQVDVSTSVFDQLD